MDYETIAFFIVFGAFFVFAIVKALQLWMKRATTGAEQLVGMTVNAETDIAPEGTVKVRGEIWNARVKKGGEHVKKGEEAKVIYVDDFVLVVKKEKGGE
jgi:membrane-bound ClpP family serine protease